MVAEGSTVAQFSAALQESARLGIKQGVAKGVTLGSEGITFAIYAFNLWYGTRLIMSHSYKGGTVYAASTSIIIGGSYVVPDFQLPATPCLVHNIMTRSRRH